MELRDRWNHLLPDAKPLGEDLLARYNEPHRAYHDQRHLTEVLETIDALEDEATDADTVRLAAWFHDAVYDPEAGPGENEEASAQLAEAELAAYGLDAAQVTEVGRLVRLTAAHHCADGDANGAVLCDADLRVLASGPRRYDEYAGDVRREYAHVADRDFARGRSAILERIAEGRIFATEPAHDAWDRPARDNLGRELAVLRPAAINRWAGLVPLGYLGASLGLVAGAALLLGRGLAAAPNWPAPDTDRQIAWWVPVAGLAAIALALTAWLRKASPKVMLALCAPLALGGAAGIVLSWIRWPDRPLETAMSERWPYLLLASIAALIGGALLAVGCRLRTTTPYSGTPPKPAGVAVVAVIGVLLGWVSMAAGEPFVQARLEEANTSSDVATAPPATTAPVRLDGEIAWTADLSGPGTIAGTAGGVAQLRPDGVVTLDAATGERRWTYRRADVTGADGHAGHGMVVSADRRVLAVHLPGESGSIELPTYAVLDAVTGAVLAELHADGAALAVDHDVLVVADGDQVVGYPVSGDEHWRTRSVCPVTRAVIAAGTVVVASSCGTTGADTLRGLATADGAPRWSAELDNHGQSAGDSPSEYRIGALAVVPDSRQVAGLGWSADAGGTLYQWVVDSGSGSVTWPPGPLPGSPRPGFGPAGCESGLLASRASVVVVACRAAVAGRPQVYDVTAANPSDGTPLWHHLLDVPLEQQHADYPARGFALLPDGRVVTVRASDGKCVPVTISTVGPAPHRLTGTGALTCTSPTVTVAGGHPVLADQRRLLALR